MVLNKITDCLVFREGEWVFISTILNVIGFPVESPVAVSVVTPWSVFIYQPVAIIIKTFITQKFIVPLLIRSNTDHLSRIRRINLHISPLTFYSHQADLF